MSRQPPLKENNSREHLRLSLSDLYSSSSPSRTSSNKKNSSKEQNKRDNLSKMMSSSCTHSDSDDDSDSRLNIDADKHWRSDTRTYIVQEIFRNEQSYVDSLRTVVTKYLNVLRTPEYAGIIDSKTVDEIFFMVPEILAIHQNFLNEMRKRLDQWNPQQKVCDVFIETFSKEEVLKTYTAFVNNCNRAKNVIKTTTQQRPTFAKFLETTAREHKGKLTLDNLLIKPVQKFPNYEMLFTRLIKHTDEDHPDRKPLQEVLKIIHETLITINCREKEILENEQRELTLRELENIIEGMYELVVPERQFLSFDLVSMPSAQAGQKDRGFFLFSDILVITSVKRKSGTLRKSNIISACPGNIASTLDTYKYKFLIKVPLDNLEIAKYKKEHIKMPMSEVEELTDDYNKLKQIAELASILKCPHMTLDETVQNLLKDVECQLNMKKSHNSQLNSLELTINSNNGNQKLVAIFVKAEKRIRWEETFNEAKSKTATSLKRYPLPEFLMSIPIRKTRAGLQFSCAAPTISSEKDVWVCNSDGYVGQVCVLSILPEPTVTSCNGVCNARILCIASVPTEKKNKQELNKPESFQNNNCSNTTTSATSNALITDFAPVKSNSNDENIINVEFDLNSSSDESDTENGTEKYQKSPPTPVADINNSAYVQQPQQDQLQSKQELLNSVDDRDNQLSTMWLGTEDGCIHIYNSTDNIRIKKNKVKIQHTSAINSILYFDNRVFVALANGDLCVYCRENGNWNTSSPLCISIGSVTSPISKLINVHGKLWCSVEGFVKTLDTTTLQIEHQFQISSNSKPVTNMAVSNNYVWISIQNSTNIKCFHYQTKKLVYEADLAEPINKMLSNCDDIIRQHKAACLRITSILACNDLIWVGTSAGVLLTIKVKQEEQIISDISQAHSINIDPPFITVIPHGHTGHVRFLTYINADTASISSSNIAKTRTCRNSEHPYKNTGNKNILVISGGDGYEDFYYSGTGTKGESGGHEDSTNHLLLWKI